MIYVIYMCTSMWENKKYMYECLQTIRSNVTTLLTYQVN